MRLLFLLSLLGLFSCATLEEQQAYYGKMISMESDCKSVTDVKFSEFMGALGSQSRWIDAKCDDRKVRCKQGLTTNVNNPFASATTFSCKDRS